MNSMFTQTPVTCCLQTLHTELAAWKPSITWKHALKYMRQGFSRVSMFKVCAVLYSAFDHKQVQL